MYGSELRLNLLFYLCHAPDIAVGTIFNVFGYNVMLGRDSNLLPSRQRVDEPSATVAG